MKKHMFSMPVLVCLALILFMGLEAQAAPRIRARLDADPNSFRDECPAVITFTGEITTDSPGNVQYKFIRSDGANAPVQTLEFNQPGTKTVSTTWTLGGPGLPTYDGWQAIEIVYPRETHSNKARFKIRCAGSQPGIRPDDRPDIRPQTDAPREDCLSFNPASTSVQHISGDWKVVDGSHWMFSFGDNRAEAEKTLSIIKHYRMDQTCYVGRPNPSFTYMLAHGAVPYGTFPGEDCVGFNPGRVEAKLINNDWKIVDGNHAMFSFGGNRDEAEQALAIIKYYGFTRSCFVGRPGPSFKYMRK